jgi:hypothetical protein
MHRAAPKGPRNPPRKCSCIGLRYSPRVNEDLYARPSNLELSKTTLCRVRRAPPSSLDAKPEQREEESG